MKFMKSNLLLLLIGAFLVSCSGEERKAAVAAVQDSQASLPDTPLDQDTIRHRELSQEEMEAMQRKCETFYASMRVTQDELVAYVDQVLASSKNQLTGNNRKFLVQLRKELAGYDPLKPKLAIEQTLFPVFQITEGEMGVFAFPVHDRQSEEYTDIAAERLLLVKAGYQQAGHLQQPNKLLHYPQALNGLYPSGKPAIYLYTTETTKRSRIKDLGIYEGECVEFYHYTFDTEALTSGDKVLFASRQQLDLVYENNPDFDAWYTSRLMPAACADCPSSHHLAKTYARLKGTDIYFMYADTFPLNDQLDTPLRMLVLKGKQDKLITLWYSDVDNFGCSCL